MRSCFQIPSLALRVCLSKLGIGFRMPSYRHTLGVDALSQEAGMFTLPWLNTGKKIPARERRTGSGGRRVTTSWRNSFRCRAG